MYASPLASFTLYIYNSVYNCPFASSTSPFLQCVHTSLFLSIYITCIYPFTHNAFYFCVASPLLVGRGFEADCHNSFITLNISPLALSLSLSFSSPHSPISLSSRFFPSLLFSSPSAISISSSHLSTPLFFITCFALLFPLHPLPHSFPHTLFEPSSAFPKVSISLTFFNNCHMPPHPTSCLPIMTLSAHLSHSPSLSQTQTCTLSPSCHIWCDLQRFNMPDNTKEPSHAKRFLYQSQQWLLTVQHINILKIKEVCKDTRWKGNWMQMELCSMHTKNNSVCCPKKHILVLNLLPEDPKELNRWIKIKKRWQSKSEWPWEVKGF